MILPLPRPPLHCNGARRSRRARRHSPSTLIADIALREGELRRSGAQGILRWRQELSRTKHMPISRLFSGDFFHRSQSFTLGFVRASVVVRKLGHAKSGVQAGDSPRAALSHKAEDYFDSFFHTGGMSPKPVHFVGITSGVLTVSHAPTVFAVQAGDLIELPLQCFRQDFEQFLSYGRSLLLRSWDYFK